MVEVCRVVAFVDVTEGVDHSPPPLIQITLPLPQIHIALQIPLLLPILTTITLTFPIYVAEMRQFFPVIEGFFGGLQVYLGEGEAGERGVFVDEAGHLFFQRLNYVQLLLCFNVVTVL